MTVTTPTPAAVETNTPATEPTAPTPTGDFWSGSFVPKQQSNLGEFANELEKSVGKSDQKVLPTDKGEQKTQEDGKQAEQDRPKTKGEEWIEEQIKGREGEKFKLKWSGGIAEATLPEVLKLASQGGRMHDAIKEARTYREENQRSNAMIELCAQNPDKYLELGEALGHNVGALSAKRAASVILESLEDPNIELPPELEEAAHRLVMERFRYHTMDDSERGRYDLDRENRKLKRQLEGRGREEKQREEQTQEQYVAQVRQQTEHEVVTFLQGLGEAGRDLDVVAKALEISIASSKSQHGRLPIAKAYEIAQADVNRKRSHERKTTLESVAEMSDDEISALPKHTLERIRKHLVATAKRSTARPVTPTAPTPARKPTPKNTPVEEAWADLERKFNGR